MPWTLQLLLPSALVYDHVIWVDDSLLQHEWDLQVAGAEEALDEIRRKIILETYVQDYRKEYGHGQCQGTRTAMMSLQALYAHKFADL